MWLNISKFVDFKKQVCADTDAEEIADDQPTIVVLKPGDLTAEEAAQEQARLEKGNVNIFSFFFYWNY